MKTFDDLASDITLPSGNASDNLNRAIAKGLREAYLSGVKAFKYAGEGGHEFVGEDVSVAEVEKTVKETNAPYAPPKA